MKTLNLPNLIEEKGKVLVTVFHSGYVDKDMFMHDGGKIIIELIQNNLTGGYVGNTLLIECKENKVNKPHTHLNINGDLYLNCILILNHENKLYTLSKTRNYLILKGIHHKSKG